MAHNLFATGNAALIFAASAFYAVQSTPAYAHAQQSEVPTPTAAEAGPAAAPANPAMPLYTSFEVIEKLREGGYIMLIRHERTEVPSRADDYTRPPAECRAQRNLSVAGVVSSHETGTLIRAAGIPIARVITSPMCRATETARYMFGAEYETDNRLMHHDPGAQSKRPLDQAARETSEVIDELAPVLADGNVALISHGGNIFKSTGLRLTEGEIGVLQLDEQGKAIAMGQFTGSTLGFYIRMKQAEEASEPAE
ncbi:MAG: hypothetical protein QNI87_02755 [Erythrobacter sp.]|uniref:hypothetical protein n=1 Tax=Erythrobacter sp. TaxID=1042 RepID=UPI0026122872|nr:hypothetical protein [Erythrobacter sp.]MDJ0977431.1 hypothetical protein [Erythrobacter sp.]